MSNRAIIAATDGSAAALQAVEWAAQEAALRQAALRIVSVVALPPRMYQQHPEGTPDTVADVLYEVHVRALADAAELTAELEPGVARSQELLSGPPAQMLVQDAADASMLVVGSRGAGTFSALVLGSVSRYTATHAGCPVVVVREESMAVRRKVVVGVGDLDRADAALGFAFEEAALRRARLLAVHAWYRIPLVTLTKAQRAALDQSEVPRELAARLEDMLTGWRVKYPEVQVEARVTCAHPARTLVAASTSADLVVLGRRSAEDHGSGVNAVGHGVLGHAHGPVAIVPGD